MLIDDGLAKRYYGESVLTVTYLQNRLRSRSIGKTLYELWRGGNQSCHTCACLAVRRGYTSQQRSWTLERKELGNGSSCVEILVNTKDSWECRTVGGSRAAETRVRLQGPLAGWGICRRWAGSCVAVEDLEIMSWKVWLKRHPVLSRNPLCTGNLEDPQWRSALKASKV